MSLIASIFYLSDRSFKIKFILLSILSCVVGMLEVFSIGTLFVLVSDDNVAVDHFNVILEFFGLQQSFEFKVIFFALALMFSTILRFALNSSSYLLTNIFSVGVSSRIFKTLISKVLIENTNQRKDEFFASIVGKVSIVSNACILSLIQIASNSIILLMIICFSIFNVSPFEIFIFLIFIIFLSLVNFSSRKTVQRNSVKISNSYNLLSTSLRETNNALVELYLYRKLTNAYTQFKNLQIILRKAQSTNQIISSLPKLTIEASVALLVLFLAIFILGDLTKQEVNNFFKDIGVLIFIIIRTLPLLQILQQSSVSLSGNKQLVFDIKKLVANSSIGDEILENENLNFCVTKQNNIIINNLSFSIKGVNVFNDLNFKIGEKNFLLISGKSGSGKSTLLKILLGFESNYTGEIIFNETEYRKMHPNEISQYFSYVPQRVEIFFGTLIHNVTLKINLSSEEKVFALLCLKKAQLDTTQLLGQHAIENFILDDEK